MDSKRRLILIAAANIIEKQGSQFTIEHVAQGAGIAKGTVYLYFSSKKELVVQVLLDGIEQLRQILKEADTGDSCSARLASIVTAHYQNMVTRAPLMQRLMHNEPELLRDLKAELLPRLLKTHEVYVDVLNQGITSGDFRPHDPGIIATSLMAMIHNLAASCTMFELQPEKALSEILALVYHGIAAENKEAFKNLLVPQEGNSCKV